MNECPDCGGAFFEPGQNSDLVQGGCPNCNRPWGLQVPGTADEGRLRNMPGVGGTSGDTGGNPLQEGILADNGWKPRNKLDESYAALEDRCPHCLGQVFRGMCENGCEGNEEG